MNPRKEKETPYRFPKATGVTKTDIITHVTEKINPPNFLPPPDTGLTRSKDILLGVGACETALDRRYRPIESCEPR